MDTPTPQTELEAVNQMLAAINEPPINSLDETDVTSDAGRAHNKLRVLTRTLCEGSWRFNREEEYEYTPDADKHIHLPSNIATWRLNRKSSWGDADYIVRNQQVYDRKNHTWEIGLALKADISLYLKFEELPSYWRTYVTAAASRRFAQEVLGIRDTIVVTKADEDSALALAREEELRAGNCKMWHDRTGQQIAYRQPFYTESTL